MMAIIISACMVGDPGVCKDYRVPIDGGYDPMSCVMHAPPHFAKWAEEHPGWAIKRWKCQAGGLNDI